MPIWRNAAISRDGSRIAALKLVEENKVWVYDVALMEWRSFPIYNPTFTEGIIAKNALYADIIEFDFTGEQLLYDAYNVIKSTSGTEDINYWDIGFIKVWDNTIDFWEQDTSNNIQKLFAGLPENISVGNPTFSRNSPEIIAFEFFDEDFFEFKFFGANLKTNDLVEIYFNDKDFNFPYFSNDDQQLIVNSFTDIFNEGIIQSIRLAEDKITPISKPRQLVAQQAGAFSGLWFATGTRLITTDKEQETAVFNLTISPNPFSSQLQLQFDTPNSTTATIEIVDLLGNTFFQKNYVLFSKEQSLNLSPPNLSKGFYFLTVKIGQARITSKILKY